MTPWVKQQVGIMDGILHHHGSKGTYKAHNKTEQVDQGLLIGQERF
jgi:hypothetical protein